MGSEGIELWRKAKSLIPGGNQLLSKSADRFLPDLWPSYYSKAKGCEIWGLDGTHYYDFAQMGVGSCVLGYADDDVNKDVIRAILDGSMTSLNCWEEVELAEKLIELHQWADMAKFARTGGEACAIAVRIARATTGRSKIAFCGYHGWHDWYLAANLENSTNLDKHLLSGLNPLGVPEELMKTAFPFNYNKIDELEAIIRKYGKGIGVIIMEPERSFPPENGFLEKVRKIATDIGAVLIFDEITSGFRMNLGGIHLTYNVEPDIAVFGKALGNGFPISAVIGRREVMDYAQDSFISSTFWTERIGFVAALATLRKMEALDVQNDLIYYGELINLGWKRLAEKYDLDIKISGIPPLTHFTFIDKPLESQTLYAQEMLEKGYLVGSSVYSTFAYSADIIDSFIENSDPVFKKIKEAQESNNFKKYLKGNIIKQTFGRVA